MRFRYVIVVFTITIFTAHAQNTVNYCDLFQKTVKLYNESDINPIETDLINDQQFNSDILQILDPDRIIFDSSLQSLLLNIGHSLKTDVLNSYCTVKESLVQRYKKDVENTLVILEKLKGGQFNFKKADSLFLGTTTYDPYYLSDKGVRCENYIKFQILETVIETTSKFDSLANDPKILQGYIDSIRLNYINREIVRIKNRMESNHSIEKVIYNAYINSLLMQFDPYCYSFSNEAFEDFKQHLSTNAKLFGFQLEINPNGEIVIASVLPGSYTWRTSSVNTGDRVLKIEAENKKSLLTEGVKLSEVLEFLESISADRLKLTLLKPDQTVKEIELFRENLEHTENSVQTFILKGESKVGYIVLPAFYTSWDGDNSFGCAQDVGRAIYFLEKEYKIESLIIDLRNNGGGSVTEAIDLAGIFIDFGTLLIARNKNLELSSIKDFNRGTMYTGPLALLVDNYSASASEMLTAVLQDYHRALIVGDTTFGKATGQSLVPVENNNMLKLTTITYFRVTGSTYQNTGVIPDITLPDHDPPVLQRIKMMKGDLPESVDKKTYYLPHPALPVQYLETKSRERVLKSDRFKKLQEIDSLFRDLTMNYLPLDFKSCYQLIRKKEEITKEINVINNFKTELFEIELLSGDKELNNTYKFYSDLSNLISRSILADPYIEEAYNILRDYQTIKTE